MREFKDIMSKHFEKHGLVEDLELLKEVELGTNKYEEAILDEQMASLKVDLAVIESDKNMEEVLKNCFTYAVVCN